MVMAISSVRTSITLLCWQKRPRWVLVKWRGRVHARFMTVVDESNGDCKGPLEEFLLTETGVPIDGGHPGSQPTRTTPRGFEKLSEAEQLLDDRNAKTEPNDFLRVGASPLGTDKVGRHPGSRCSAGSRAHDDKTGAGDHGREDG